MRKRTLNKSKRDEKGQALIVVLILMLLGGLIIAPLLAYMGTGIKVGKEVFEERMYGQYAADSGVEDALYKIRVDDPALPPEWEGAWTTGDPYDTPFTYSTPQLNDNDVEVTIQPQWALQDLEDPPPGMTPHADMVVVGDTIETTGDSGEYQISMTYDGEIGQLKIERIGVWLPAGCDYTEGTSNLEQADPSEKYHCVPVSQPHRGGEAIIWNFGPPQPKFTDFPGEGNKRVVTFEFTADQAPYSAFSWVVSKRNDIYLSWDVDIKIFKITSQATDIDSGKSVAVEAYTAKNEPRELGSAILGDYCAVGGTLMTATGSGDEEKYRDRLFMESSATVTDADIPTSATVEAAYLYWSGWIDYHYKYQDEDGFWRWETKDELKYPADPTLENLGVLVEEEAKVNRVSFGIIGNMTEITTDEWQAEENIDQADTWSYSCFYDATELIKGFIETGEIAANGVPSVDGKYTLSHVPEDRVEFFYDLYPSGDTGYPLGTPATRRYSWESYFGRYEWAYAGWSLIIIYSSAETKGHQLYLYDDFAYAAEVSNVDFDNDGEEGGTISGFLAPEEIIDEDYAAKLTCFVGEGDEDYDDDYIKVKGETGTETYLSNAESPTNNVWNSKSPGLEEDGIDIDTFEIPYPAIRPGDTSAQVDLPTDNDSWNLVYIILSFRSEVTTGGAITYIYVGGG